MLELTPAGGRRSGKPDRDEFPIPKFARPARERGLYRFMYSNIGFIGYPIVGALFGEGALFHVTIFVLFFICWSYGAQTTSRAKTASISIGGFSNSLRRRLSASAYADLSQRAERVPQPVSDLLHDRRADITAGHAYYRLSRWRCTRSKRCFTNWRVYALAVIKMVLLPVIAFFVLRLFLGR